MRFLALLLLAVPAAAQISPDHYSGMRWRQIGPFRAGRVSAVAGIPGNAAIYYMGTPGGGIWKTVNAGTTWLPISDGQIPVSSIGSIVVSPSNPNILYAGTGDVSNVGGAVNEGDGVYKSIDAGKTWRHIGLDETEHVVSLWIHPTNPDIVIAAALGKTFAPNSERGIFKTTDGGRSWRKVLYKDDTTGAVDLSFTPDNPNIGYATIWYHYVKAGNARAQIEGTGGGGIYKTIDGGETWTPLTGGLPTNQIGRIGVAAAPGGQRAFAIIAAGRGSGGLYRTDDGGANWTKSSPDSRIQGSGYFSRVFLDPKSPDVVYVAQTSLYRSDDGGHNFVAYKGAPGGDDNHALWIDPRNSDRMILASDQGGTISMDRGLSWSSWYNQPTGQIYHLSVDNRYPYWVYGTQQDSGAIGTLSRGDYGNITFMDWDPVAGYEFGYIIPDPLNNNILFSGAPARGLVKIDRVNRQTANISPNVSRDGDYRTAVNPPLAFSPQDPHILYWGTQFLMETHDAGVTWKHASPDLTKRPETAAKDAKPADEDPTIAVGLKPKAREADETVRPPDRSAINTFSLSPIKAGQIWVGTTNGLIQLSQDAGASWTAVTPPGLTQYSLISMIEVSHFDPATAYVAVDRHEENDSRPHILITRDSGKTWTETVAGIPARSFVRVVRQDPTRKGLLYAGTETAAYVSFDDGAQWSSLQNNMPVTSVRDMVVHGDDLVVCTYGRAFWVLDDLTPLRQIDRPINTTFLFKPEKAIRIRRDQNGDTPIPPELPAGTNPPDGALIDYYLNASPNSDIQMAIYDSNGNLVRELSSKPEPKSTEPPPNVPEYWLARPAALPLKAGLNRFVWDLRYASPPVVRHEYPISALYENTPAEPVGAIATPGKYEVRLTVNGQTYKQSLELTMDPRVDVSPAALTQEFTLEQTVQGLVKQSYEAYHQALLLHESLEKIPEAKDLDAKVVKLQGSQVGGPGGGGAAGGKPNPTFVLLNRELGSLATAVDSADTGPTEAMRTAYSDYCNDLAKLATAWNDLVRNELPAFKVNAQPLTAPAACK
jgi:photosystem II stability/assembly factor-like uncharacterized protein